MHQQSLQDIRSPLQVHTPHAAALIQVREASLGQFAPQFLQSLVALATYPSPILIRPLLLFSLPFALPLPSPAVGFRDVTSNLLRMDLLQHSTAVIALIGHYLLYSLLVDFARCRLGFPHRLLDRRCVPLVRYARISLVDLMN